MKLWVEFKNFLSVFLLFLSACSSLDRGSQSTIRFQNPVTVSSLDGRETSYNAGDTLTLSADPVYVEAPGRVGVLVVPMESRSGNNELRLRRIENWSGEELGRQLNQNLNTVLSRVIEAQRAIARRSGREALSIVEELQAKHPELTYLNFLKASSYVLLGDRERARSAVEAGLASFPEDASGQALLRSLGSGR